MNHFNEWLRVKLQSCAKAKRLATKEERRGARRLSANKKQGNRMKAITLALIVLVLAETIITSS